MISKEKEQDNTLGEREKKGEEFCKIETFLTYIR